MWRRPKICRRRPRSKHSPPRSTGCTCHVRRNAPRRGRARARASRHVSSSAASRQKLAGPRIVRAHLARQFSMASTSGDAGAVVECPQASSSAARPAGCANRRGQHRGTSSTRVLGRRRRTRGWVAPWKRKDDAVVQQLPGQSTATQWRLRDGATSASAAPSSSAGSTRMEKRQPGVAVDARPGLQHALAVWAGSSAAWYKSPAPFDEHLPPPPGGRAARSSGWARWRTAPGTSTARWRQADGGNRKAPGLSSPPQAGRRWPPGAPGVLLPSAAPPSSRSTNPGSPSSGSSSTSVQQFGEPAGRRLPRGDEDGIERRLRPPASPYRDVEGSSSKTLRARQLGVVEREAG